MPERYCCDGDCAQGKHCPRLDPQKEESSVPSLVVGTICVLVVLVTLSLLTHAV